MSSLTPHRTKKIAKHFRGVSGISTFKSRAFAFWRSLSPFASSNMFDFRWWPIKVIRAIDISRPSTIIRSLKISSRSAIASKGSLPLDLDIALSRHQIRLFFVSILRKIINTLVFQWHVAGATELERASLNPHHTMKMWMQSIESGNTLVSAESLLER